MIDAQIATLLLTHLETEAANLSPPMSVAWPNRSFAPTAAPWLRATLLPAMTETVTTDSDRKAGLLQVDVFHKPNIGEIELLRIADQIIRVFSAQTRFEADDGFSPSTHIVVQIEPSPYRLALSVEESWAMVPIRIPWLCYINRGD